MKVLTNRIVISLVIIAIAVWLWEFEIKPVSGPEYTAAVMAYKSGQYRRSIQLLDAAYRIDPNDTAILTLYGWDNLKLRHFHRAEKYFHRSDLLVPKIEDTDLGYAYTEIALKKYEHANALLAELNEAGDRSADVRIAWGTLYRKTGRNLAAAGEFRKALALRPGDRVAAENLRRLYNLPANSSTFNLQFQPIKRPSQLTYDFSAHGDFFQVRNGPRWAPTYLSGVVLNAALPGEFPVDSTTNPDVYNQWLGEISGLGVNTIRLTTILPPAFYRAFYEFNRASGHRPLWLLQGVTFPDPPSDDDLFEGDYYQACKSEVEDAVDVIHGQGDVPANHLHSGGLYPDDISPWVAGFVIGNAWVSHIVIGDNQLHPDMTSYQGDYFRVASGTPTEIFLAQMLNDAAQYEQQKYNWQHPLAFLNTPTLDPMTHPTESTTEEEMAIRRRLGERFKTPPGPFDDDDAVADDPMHLVPTQNFDAGYFADYSVFPFYPDFMDDDPGYLKTRDSEGSDPFLGYLLDLKAHHEGVPLVISDYGLPSSLGIGHFNPAGFNEGGETELQQGQLLARLTQNVYDVGAAGGMVYEWLDEWYRRSWLVRNFEVPADDKPLWTNLMDPLEYYGLEAADPTGPGVHQLQGRPSQWKSRPLLYQNNNATPYHPLNDGWDPARNLKSLSVDADEAFLYLHLVVNNLDPKRTGRVDWSKVNYLIGIGTDPGNAGLEYLPYVAPVHFPIGMTYAIHLAGPTASDILIASSYDPYQLVSVTGIPSEKVLGLKSNWVAIETDNGTFDQQLIEPNRRRFARNGHYFPAIQYDRGLLRYGTLNLASYDYDSLAEWYVNMANHSIDIRIPWALLGVTDPPKFQVVSGITSNGKVETTTTPGFAVVALSYRPSKRAANRPIMQQGNPITDSLPALSGPANMPAGEIRQYLWARWNAPQYKLRLKASYAVLQKSFESLPTAPRENPLALSPARR